LLLTLAFARTTALTGCAYRLAPWTLPSQQRLKIVGASAEQYVIRLRIHDLKEYRVVADGRVTLDVPAEHGECSVYLFNLILVQRGVNPFTVKTVEIVRGGKPMRKLSLKEIAQLPADSEAYHLLTFDK